MLRGPGGRERTEKEYRQLLTENGFRPIAVYGAGRFNLVDSCVAEPSEPGATSQGTQSHKTG